jgi:hypothetical protein
MAGNSFLPFPATHRRAKKWLLRHGLRGTLRRFFIFVLSVVFLIDTLKIGGHNPEYDWYSTRVHPEPPREYRIFIASIHRNNEAILSSHWCAAVIELAKFFGPDNVYVSLYESGSIDNTKGVLQAFDQDLESWGVRRTVILDEHDQLEEVANAPEEYKPGWVYTSENAFELRRIPYLANLRNEVMKPLYEEEEVGRSYDYVLWLNDVVFTVEDVMTLLQTRDGQWDSVCALDFSVNNKYYDTFALRDALGQKAEPIDWPFFVDSTARQAVRHNEPLQVKSCWNGVIAMKASPFYGPSPLKFRGVPDSLAQHHLEGSECCLIHADNSAKLDAANKSQGVWLNPNVRVGYKPEVYKAVNPQKWVSDRGGKWIEKTKWPGGARRIIGMWKNRIARLPGYLKGASEKAVVSKRIAAWESEGQAEGESRKEEGDFCIINEMQVLYSAGWKHRD